MKRIISLSVSLIVLFFFSTQTLAQTNYKPVLFLSSEAKQVVTGQPVTVSLIANTLGNNIQIVEAHILLEGDSIPESGFTYNLYPNKAGDNFNMDVYEETERQGKKEIHMRLRSTSADGVNWGSSAVPLVDIRFISKNEGSAVAYINNDTSIWYRDQIVNFDNYSTADKPYVVSVIPSVTTPAPTSVPQPAPTTSPTEMPNYDEQYQELKKEVASLKTEVNNQEKRLTLIEQIIASIQKFFSRILGR